MSTVDEILQAAEDSDDELYSDETFNKMKLDDILSSNDDELLSAIPRPVDPDVPTRGNVLERTSNVNLEGGESFREPRNSSLDARALDDILCEDEEDDVTSTLDRILAEADEKVEGPDSTKAPGLVKSDTPVSIPDPSIRYYPY